MREEHGWVVVAPRGEIDLLTAPEVRDALVAAPGPRVALDLRGVGFLDTSGLRVILEHDRRADETGVAFAVLRGSDAVTRLLRVAGLYDLLTICDTLGPDGAGA